MHLAAEILRFHIFLINKLGTRINFKDCLSCMRVTYKPRFYCYVFWHNLDHMEIYECTVFIPVNLLIQAYIHSHSHCSWICFNITIGSLCILRDLDKIILFLHSSYFHLILLVLPMVMYEYHRLNINIRSILRMCLTWEVLLVWSQCQHSNIWNQLKIACIWCFCFTLAVALCIGLPIEIQ